MGSRSKKSSGLQDLDSEGEVTMEKHVTFVAVLNIAFGFLGLFLAVFLFFVIVGAGIISGEPEAMTATSIIGTAIGFFLVLTSLPEIIGGFGLLKKRAWARILILVIACLDLLWIPIGTLIGIYEIWVLLNEDTVKLFVEEPSA
jgi:hypothetical protein